jgi:hypothetical protein
MIGQKTANTSALEQIPSVAPINIFLLIAGRHRKQSVVNHANPTGARNNMA